MPAGEEPVRTVAFPLAVHGGSVFPSDVDLRPSPDRYVGFYENMHGEQLVYVHERDRDPLLFHGDHGWSPVTATWPEIQTLPGTPLAPWVAGDLILNQGEVLWLSSCLDASQTIMGRSAPREGPLDRLALSKLQQASQHHHDQIDRQLARADEALEQWIQSHDTTPPYEHEHYAMGVILVELGVNQKLRRPKPGMTQELRERIARDATQAAREVQQ